MNHSKYRRRRLLNTCFESILRSVFMIRRTNKLKLYSWSIVFAHSVDVIVTYIYICFCRMKGERLSFQQQKKAIKLQMSLSYFVSLVFIVFSSFLPTVENL